MSLSPDDTPQICHYYVDEAGDMTLFNRRGKVIIGDEGCSNYFMMGLLEIPHPEKLTAQLEALRRNVAADPYFSNVPSMQPKHKKTAVAFHAKDDLPEIRKEVFAILRNYDGLRFFAVVKHKRKEVEYIREMQKADAAYRYIPNQLYDFLISRLFRGRLHTANEYNIYFAKRGSADRTNALRDALKEARNKSKVSGNIAGSALMNISTLKSADHFALQAVDYFLWALQRFYERKEDRYLNYLWPAFRLIIDIDDKKHSPAGCHYTQKKPVLLASIAE